MQPVMASHILGGQMKYKHLQGRRYLFTVEIYRDCGGCKLNGNGGGFSKDNCDDISRLFITDPTNGSSVINRGSIVLQRSAVLDISPVCAKALNACNNSSGIAGIEKHTFTGEFDFSSITTSDRCQFEIHLQIASRANELSNGMAAEKFHITSFINLCSGQNNNSPIFQSEPVFQLQKDAVYRLSHSAIDADGDSLVYQLVRPYTDFGVSGAYSSGYGANYPLSCYCPFGGNCQPIPEMEIPSGFYLSPENGRMVFTPVKASEHSVVCVEIQEYRKVGSQMVMIGSSRRDIQVSVLQSGNNQSPEILNPSSYSVCVDQEFCLDFELTDEPYLLGSENRYDTLALTVNTSGTQGTLNRKSKTEAPYFDYTWCFTPPASDSFSRKKIIAEVRDQFCPRPLISQKSIEISILPLPKASIEVDELPCNMFRLSFSANMSMTEFRWSIYNETNQLIFEKYGTTDSFILKNKGRYRIRLTLNNGACHASFERIIEVQSDLEKVIEIEGSNQICAEDTLELTARAGDGYQIVRYRWYAGSQEVGSLSELRIAPTQNQSIQLIATIEKDGIRCHSSDTQTVNVLFAEKPDFQWQTQICAGGEIDLSGIQVIPGGEWAHFPENWINGTQIIIPNNLTQDAEARLIYRIRDANNCIGTYVHPYKVLAAETFALKDVSICKGDGLKITLNPLIQYSTRSADELNWDLSSVDPYTSFENGVLIIRLSEMASGTYKTAAWYQDDRGCIASDTAEIRLQPDLVISKKTQIPDICLGQGETNLFELSGIQPRGGGFSSDHPEDFILQGILKESTCGKRIISYTYDQFNCFARTEFEVEVMCKPEIELHASQKKICDAAPSVQLLGSPSGGRWSGENVTPEGVLSINPLSQPKLLHLNYTVSLGTCSFSESIPVEIHPSPQWQIAGLKNEYCEGDTLEITAQGTGLQELHLLGSTGYFNTQFVMPPGLNSHAWNKHWILDAKSISETEIRVVPVHELHCPDLSQRFSLRIHPSPIIKAPGKLSGCHPYTATLDAELLNYPISQAIFTWDTDNDEVFTSENMDLVYNYLLPGTYHPSLTISLSNGCHKKTVFKDLVTVYETPVARFRSSPEEYVSNAHPAFQFINESQSKSPLRFLWDFGSPDLAGIAGLKNPLFKYPSDTSEYMVTLTATGEGGCTDVFSRKVIVGPDIKLFIPNAFSPDQRGPESNNRFGVQGQNIKSLNIEVFDRWGMKVFQGQQLSETWDGTHQNRPCLPGVYTYSIRAVTQTGNEYHYSGTLHLLR